MPPLKIAPAATQAFSLVDLSDPMENVAFESAFFQAFSRIKKQNLLREIWNWDDVNGRISLKTSPAETLIFCWKVKDKKLFYVGGSSRNNAFSQFRYFGFEPPDMQGRYAEVMILFATEHFDGNLSALVNEFLMPYCYNRAKEYGNTHLLATCAPPLLALYLRWGWKLLESKNVRGETRHFLLFEL